MPLHRVAILECDTPLTRTREVYGGYGGVFTALLQTAAKSLGMPVEELDLTKWDVVEKRVYPKVEDIDAILITGSSM